MTQQAQQPDKSIKLYNNKIQIDFWNRKGRRTHVYEAKNLTTGNELPVFSVTKMINRVEDKSGMLMAWAAKLAREGKDHNKESKAAADVGTQVHRWIEKYIKTGEREAVSDNEVLNCTTAFLNWEQKMQPQFHNLERIVYSKRYGYCGLVDSVFSLPSEKHKYLHVQDFKTSKDIYLPYIFQVEAYRRALIESKYDPAKDHEEAILIDGDRLDKMEFGANHILRLDKATGDYEEGWFDDHDNYFEVVKSCAKIQSIIDKM